MQRIILAGLIALLPTVAFARAPMETNQLVDGNGNPVGTADNPLVVTGGTGGGGSGGATGSVTPAGTNGTAAQAVQGINGGVPLAITGSFLLDTTFTGRINTLGQKTSAQSTPVVLPSDQTVPVSATSLPLPSGASTSAAQSTGNASLASIDGKAPSLVGGRVPVDGSGVTQTVVQSATAAITAQRTTGIGTTGTQVSASDATNRRTVTNTSTIACELMGSAAAYGTGYPLPAGGSFTFDSGGRTTAALFVACASTGGTVAVLSY